MGSQPVSVGIGVLNIELLKMGGAVETGISLLGDLIQVYKGEVFEFISDNEKKINFQHKKIDEGCVEYIAKYSPKAIDLRWVFAVAKINADLERIGDQCQNCAYLLRDLNKKKSIDFKEEISQIVQLTQSMVSFSLDSFTRRDSELAQEVLKMDDQVDQLKETITNLALTEIKKNPENVESFLDIIMLSRNIERIGDHATNIAEDVIYVCRGIDVRHGGDYV